MNYTSKTLPKYGAGGTISLCFPFSLLKDCQVSPSEDESTQHQEKTAVAGFKPGGHAQAPAGRESSFCRGKRKVGGLSTQSPSFSLAGPHQTVHVSAWPCRGESSPCWSPDCLTEVSVRG